jgi:hypothetical protein
MRCRDFSFKLCLIFCNLKLLNEISICPLGLEVHRAVGYQNSRVLGYNGV